VLEGELELRHGEQDCALEEGDAVYFDSSTPHSYQCAGIKPAQAIIVTMHQTPTAMPLRAPSAARTAGTSNPAPAGVINK
jgi:quercetin dioxygenase-like cupin family protein